MIQKPATRNTQRVQITILRSAGVDLRPDQALTVPQFLPASATKWNRQIDGWDRGFQVATILIGQAIVEDSAFPQLLPGRMGRGEQDVVGPQFLDLFLSFSCDPLTDRQQPDDAGDSDEDAQDRQQRSQWMHQQALQPDAQIS